jgi:dihydroorotate dehydrogenase
MFNQTASLFQPLLLKFDPETAHTITIRTLEQMGRVQALMRCTLPSHDQRLKVDVLGQTFPNPLGLAAGFDKQAQVIDPLLRLGFGFVEAGGVTPLPQEGNARPRVFRLPNDGAVINRYGLNSEGLEIIAKRLEARRATHHVGGIVGINMGANKDSSDRIADYVTCMKRLAGLTDFATINVSSPNTPGLRDLQGEEMLKDILKRTMQAREDAMDQGLARTAVLLKIAPDISLPTLDGILDIAVTCGIDGVIIANTTVSRPIHLHHMKEASQTGGLSGRPLFDLSTKLLAHAYTRIGKRLPLIGVGGIESGETAWRKIEAGASLIQLYTALIYQGPALITQILDHLVARLASENLSSLIPVIGRASAELAKEL